MHWYGECAWLAAIALLSAGCSSAAGCYIWAQEAPDTLTRPASMAIQAGDQIVVTVKDQEALSGQLPVGEDGHVVVPVVGAVQVAGQTTDGAERTIAARLQGVVVSPQVTVVLMQRRPFIVSVMGEVRTPGRFEMVDSVGVLDALGQAGGLTEFADTDTILLLRRAGGPIRIRFDYTDLLCGDSRSNAITLRHGDVIVVE